MAVPDSYRFPVELVVCATVDHVGSLCHVKDDKVGLANDGKSFVEGLFSTEKSWIKKTPGKRE